LCFLFIRHQVHPSPSAHDGTIIFLSFLRVLASGIKVRSYSSKKSNGG
jgi:hypothetical protein